MGRRRFVPDLVRFERRALLDATPVSLVGDTLMIRGAAGGHTAAIVSYGADDSILEVQYGTGISFDDHGNIQFGPLESTFLPTASVARIAFAGSGDHNVIENDTIFIPEHVFVVGDHNSYVGGPEYDLVVMVGSDNSAFGDVNYGDRADQIFLIDRA